MVKLKCLELFAGAGGLALGIEKAGFDSIGLIEIDKDASQTLKQNRPKCNVIDADICKISQQNLETLFNIKKGELDLLSGDPPCQSFSYAGNKKGLDDARGTLFYHYAIFLQKLQPKMFFFENVDGLQTHDNGKTFKIIHKSLSEAGYFIKFRILNAWDYGVAQKRKRIIVIGIRKDLSDNHTFSYPQKHAYKLVLRDILKDVPNSAGADYSEEKKRVFDLVPAGGYWRDIPENEAKSYMKGCWGMGGGRTGILRRLSYDEPSLTVLTSPAQKQTDRCHPIETRPFTVRENARIQGFPDDWEFYGSLSSQYKQIGNAVPVNLAYEVAKQIKITLEEKVSWKLNFITREQLTEHIRKTVHKYDENLYNITLKKFNSNIIDPIKFLFNLNVYRTNWKTLVQNEIFRQKDKSTSNEIGYFHQNIFSYIKNCKVPDVGWDVVYSQKNGVTLSTGETVKEIVCELKNKHNTMNSASAGKTFIRMQNHLLNNSDSACFLVETIAKKSQDIIWSPSVDKQKVSNNRIHRVSIDKFYEIIIGDQDAFYKLCDVLVDLIPEVIEKELIDVIPEDTAYLELENLAQDKQIPIIKALYLLAFSTYNGFDY